MDFSFLISQVDSAVFNMKVAGDLILNTPDNSALLAELEAVKAELVTVTADRDTFQAELAGAQVQIDVLTEALSAANALIEPLLPAPPVSVEIPVEETPVA